MQKYWIVLDRDNPDDVHLGEGDTGQEAAWAVGELLGYCDPTLYPDRDQNHTPNNCHCEDMHDFMGAFVAIQLTAEQVSQFPENTLVATPPGKEHRFEPKPERIERTENQKIDPFDLPQLVCGCTADWTCTYCWPDDPFDGANLAELINPDILLK